MSAKKVIDVMDTRRAKLKLLTGSQTPTALAKLLGYSGPSYISQMIGGHRPITEKTARRTSGERPVAFT